jgi:hypothetical protein
MNVLNYLNIQIKTTKYKAIAFVGRHCVRPKSVINDETTE